MFGLLALLVAIVAGVAYLVQYLAYLEHGMRLKAYAAERGWQHTARDHSLVDRYVGHPFGIGIDRRVRHVLRGRHRDREVVAFEYTFKDLVGRGVRRAVVSSGVQFAFKSYQFTVVALATPAPRPKLAVGRKGLGRAVLGYIGRGDLELRSVEFDKAFLVRSEDDEFATAVLHRTMTDWLLTDPRARTTPFRFERADLLVWRAERFQPSTVDDLLEYACDVLDRTPFPQDTP